MEADFWQRIMTSEGKRALPSKFCTRKIKPYNFLNRHSKTKDYDRSQTIEKGPDNVLVCNSSTIPEEK